MTPNAPRPVLDHWSIYGLRLPGGTIRYVGSTRSDIEARLDSHRSLARANPTTKMHKWMARVGPYRVESVLLEATPVGDEKALDAAETGWIALFKEQGAALLNMTAGGSGRSHDEAAQQKRREKMSGEHHWNYGQTVSEATKARISARLKERAAAGLNQKVELTEAQRKVISDQASTNNHRRWHVARSIVKEGCLACDAATDTSSDARA